MTAAREALLAFAVSVALGSTACGDEPNAATDSSAASVTEAAPLPFYSDPYFTAEWIPADDPAYADIHQVGAFAFCDQSGQTITNADVAGKIHVANFFFTSCPSVCPKMTGNLLAVQEAFASDDGVVMLSYSVQPSVDTVEVLAAYARKHGIDGARWHLLTGDHDQIYALARESYFVEKGVGVAKPRDAFLHTENVVLVDREGRLRGIYNATLPADVARLIADVRLLHATG